MTLACTSVPSASRIIAVRSAPAWPVELGCTVIASMMPVISPMLRLGSVIQNQTNTATTVARMAKRTLFIRWDGRASDMAVKIALAAGVNLTPGCQQNNGTLKPTVFLLTGNNVDQLVGALTGKHVFSNDDPCPLAGPYRTASDDVRLHHPSVQHADHGGAIRLRPGVGVLPRRGGFHGGDDLFHAPAGVRQDEPADQDGDGRHEDDRERRSIGSARAGGSGIRHICRH